MKRNKSESDGFVRVASLWFFIIISDQFSKQNSSENSFQSFIGIFSTFPFQTYQNYSTLYDRSNIEIEIIGSQINICESTTSIVTIFKLQNIYNSPKFGIIISLSPRAIYLNLSLSQC